MFKPPQQSLKENEVYRQEMVRKAQEAQRRRDLPVNPTGKKVQSWVGDQLIHLGTRLKGEQ